MRISLVILSAFLLVGSSRASGAEQDYRMSKQVSIEWPDSCPRGQIRVSDGVLTEIRIATGKGNVEGKNRFNCSQAPLRLDVLVKGSEISYGKGSTIITVEAEKNSFSFFLRDARSEYPIYMPAYGVVVTEANDRRSYHEIAEVIRLRGLQSNLQRIQSEPEESFEVAAQNTRSLSCQTWLGLSRDMRIFALGERLEWIQPRFHGHEVSLPETNNQPCRYDFVMGRGWGAMDRISRSLEEGVLPILWGRLVDEDITYDLTAFAALETSPLSNQTVRGTHFLVADGFGLGHMFTKEQQALYDSLLPAEMNQSEETVFCARITATNTSFVPRYAFFKDVTPLATHETNLDSKELKWSFDGAHGVGQYQSGRAFSVARLNGMPLSQEEIAVELKPGETATFELYLPHRPISNERALKLAKTKFSDRLDECRAFWKSKLGVAAQIDLPEQRIKEMIQAGLLHLDLITYGQEPKGTLTSTIGVYSAIGSESAPIIQFMDSMGWHDVARRALMYFLDKQHEDGFIQNFGDYMLETGAALWSLGEHYRYTRDDGWVKEISPKLLKSCEYLLKWRQRNQTEKLRGSGYGMLEGKTADPNDPFHSFMLNGYAYLGLSRVAEMLAKTEPAQSERLNREAEALRNDIRSNFFSVMGNSPVVPLGDGTWCPTVPPWTEYRGPLALYADGGKWYTHGSIVSRDSLLGPLYLAFQEVLNPEEPATTFLLSFHNELMTKRNVVFSQPYYSRHPILHLRRGEVKPFLKAYYNTVSSLADRETYTFWEHFFGASPHKTHEEGWFLMDTRWMLYMERGETLKLLPGVPRNYLQNGKRIELKNVASYFGPLSLRVESRLDESRIDATVECLSDRRPKTVELRLPHPGGRKAIWVKGGTYDPTEDLVRITSFGGRSEVSLGFSQGKE